MKKVVAEFEGRLNIKVRQQEKLNIVKNSEFRREELLEKYIIRMLYSWDDGKFEEKYLKKLERN